MRTSKKKKDIVVQVDVAATVRLVITLLMSVILIVTLFFVIRSFLPVTRFEIDGVMTYKIYDTSELVGASGIKRGDKLYGIDIDDAEEKILSECVYIENIKIKRRFPNKIVFQLEEKLPHWYIELAGKYYSLDKDLKIIEEVKSDTSYVAAGITKLELPKIKRAVVGELPSFGDGELEVKKTLETISSIRSTPFKARITGVDLKSRFNVYMEVDSNREVYMGDASNMDSKLEALSRVIDSLGEDDKATYIDASNPAAISIGTTPRLK